MKLILCTLAICLSLIAYTFTLSNLVRTESKKTRSSIPKALTESLNPSTREESVIQKLDAINAQLTSLSRRISLLEEGSGGHSVRTAVSTGSADPAQADTRALAKSLNSLGTSLARLDGLPSHLAELTTFIDRSFGHLEKTVTETAAPQDLLTPINQMAVKIDNIDSYFTPLYAFLGLAYDPANQDLIATYPSVDERINALTLQIDAVHKEVSDIRYMLSPRIIEPTHRP